MEEKCIWKYRPGTNDSHFAFTPCRPGFNFLSKLSNSKPYVGVADYYNGYRCPICDKVIQMDYRNIEKEMM
jgi:hypothetical protein